MGFPRAQCRGHGTPGREEGPQHCEGQPAHSADGRQRAAPPEGTSLGWDFGSPSSLTPHHPPFLPFLPGGKRGLPAASCPPHSSPGDRAFQPQSQPHLASGHPCLCHLPRSHSARPALSPRPTYLPCLLLTLRPLQTRGAWVSHLWPCQRAHGSLGPARRPCCQTARGKQHLALGLPQARETPEAPGALGPGPSVLLETARPSSQGCPRQHQAGLLAKNRLCSPTPTALVSVHLPGV